MGILPPRPPQNTAFLIESNRCMLRRLELCDAKFIVRLLNEPSFLRFIGDKGVRNLADARRYLEGGPLESYRRHGFGLLLTTLRDTGAPIGICGLVKRDTLADVDLGFAFLAAHAGRGYATEAATAVLRHARHTLGLRRVVAIAAPDNHASAAVLGKVGLRFERLVTLTADGPQLRLFGPANWH